MRLTALQLDRLRAQVAHDLDEPIREYRRGSSADWPRWTLVDEDCPE